jgi:hypothetical protein
VSRFTWNAGGWFGGQAGATIWLLLLGFILMFRDPVAGGVAIGCATLANLVGLGLWTNRKRISAYAGIQAMMGSTAVLALIAVIICNGRLSAPRIPLWVLLTYPGVMLQFMLMERAARSPEA